jgi:hypothetical protein
MILGVPASELLLLAGLIVVAGLVTGILAGLFGIGGGALIVPVLYEVFGVLGVSDVVRFQLCVGTSIAIIVPTNVLSYRAHQAKGLVMMDVLRAWAVPSVVGGRGLGDRGVRARRGAQARVRADRQRDRVQAAGARHLAARRKPPRACRHDWLRLFRGLCSSLMGIAAARSPT